MDIVQLVEKKILLVAERILEVLGDGTDYISFEMELKRELDGLGCEILGSVLKALYEKFFKCKDRKPLKIVAKTIPKRLSPFGQVIFKRRYYRNRLTGNTRC